MTVYPKNKLGKLKAPLVDLLVLMPILYLKMSTEDTVTGVPLMAVGILKWYFANDTLNSISEEYTDYMEVDKILPDNFK
jgi:hypothetical protein